MAEELEQVVGLSGEEVIKDLLDQIGRKLRLDCNLRGSDCYDYGFSATVKVSMRLYGLDDVPVDMTVETKGGNIDGDPIREVESSLEIPREPDLELVRRRSEQETPDVENRDNDTSPTPRQKRKYNRHIPASDAADGGSEGILAE